MDTQEQGTAERVRSSAADVAGTMKDEAKTVVGEAGTQARSVVSDARGLVKDEVQSQAHRISASIRQWSDDLGAMAEGQTNAPPAESTADLVRQVARSGRRAADYLDAKNVDDVLDDVRAFARRRPGTFLAAAAIAGLAVGRFTKSAASAKDKEPSTTAAEPITASPQAAVQAQVAQHRQPMTDLPPAVEPTLDRPTGQGGAAGWPT